MADAPAPTDEIDAEFAQYRSTGTRELRDALVLRYTRLVKSVAAQRARGSDIREDLEQIGFVGLIKAVERFDPHLGVPFEAYARTIIGGEISHYLRDLAPVLRQPRWYRTLNRRLHAAREALIASLGREPTVQELAEKMNVTAEGVHEILKLRENYNLISLSDGEGSWSEPRLEVIRSRRHMTFQLPIEDRIVLDRAIEKLSEFQRAVVHLFYYNDLSQSEIAKQLGLSQKHVSRTLAKSLERLKRDIS